MELCSSCRATVFEAAVSDRSSARSGVLRETVARRILDWVRNPGVRPPYQRGRRLRSIKGGPESVQFVLVKLAFFRGKKTHQAGFDVHRSTADLPSAQTGVNRLYRSTPIAKKDVEGRTKFRHPAPEPMISGHVAVGGSNSPIFAVRWNLNAGRPGARRIKACIREQEGAAEVIGQRQYKRLAIALLAACVMPTAGVMPIVAQAAAATSTVEQPRSPSEIGLSQPGNYLAGLIASADRDAASAEAYYREALRVDPRNPDLLERAFAAALSNGDEQTANALGERLLTRDPTNNLARLAIAVHEIEQGQFALARTHLASADGRPKDVTTTLLAAWCYAGKGDLGHALETLDRIRDPSFAAFRDYHAGLISAQLGSPLEARRRLKSAYDADKNALRFADAYARFLANHGDFDGAKKIYSDFSTHISHHPIVEQAVSDLNSGQAPAMLVRDAKQGAAEVLYGLGAAGSRQGDELPALIYLRLSLYLRPANDLTAVTLAESVRTDETRRTSDHSLPARATIFAIATRRGNSGRACSRQLGEIGRGDQAPG